MLAPSADAIIESLNSYTEMSPSRRGRHVVLEWLNPNGYTKLATVIDGQSVEIITSGNFVTFTGDVVRSGDIEDRTQLLEKFYSYAGWKRNIPKTPNLSSSLHNKCTFGVCPYAAPALEDEVARIRKAKKGSRTKTILGAARRIGRFLYEEHLDENAAITELERAGEFTGLNNDTPGKIAKTVAAGIAAGKKTPKTNIHSYHPIRLTV